MMHDIAGKVPGAMRMRTSAHSKSSLTPEMRLEPRALRKRSATDLLRDGTGAAGADELDAGAAAGCADDGREGLAARASSGRFERVPFFRGGARCAGGRARGEAGREGEDAGAAVMGVGTGAAAVDGGRDWAGEAGEG